MNPVWNGEMSLDKTDLKLFDIALLYIKFTRVIGRLFVFYKLSLGNNESHPDVGLSTMNYIYMHVQPRNIFTYLTK